VASRGVPFDVNLGFDARGRIVAAYSRCAGEPALHGGANPRGGGGLPQYATGRGCTIRLLDLATGSEQDTGILGVLPAVGGQALAFVRAEGGGAVVLVRDLVTRASRVLQRGPLRRAARSPPRFDSRVFVEGRHHRRPTLVAGATNTSDTPFVTAFSPTLGAGRVTYLLSFGTGFCERRWARGRPSPAYGLQRSSSPASPVSAAVDGGRLVVAEVAGPDGGEIAEFGQRPFTGVAGPGELCA
jgi:hypothetical protein